MKQYLWIAGGIISISVDMTFSALVLRNMIQQPILEGIKINEYANVGLLSHMIQGGKSTSDFIMLMLCNT